MPANLMQEETKEISAIDAELIAVSDDDDGEQKRDSPQDASSENEKKREAENKKFEELGKEFGEKKPSAPLRFLALPPLYKSVARISIADYDRLRATVISDDTITKISRRKHEASRAEIIIRACHLLFALVESGGLGAGAPEREITRLRINVAEARCGMLQPVSAREPNPLAAENSKAIISAADNLLVLGEETKSAATATEGATDDEMPFMLSGLRQPLYALGRFHLNSFIRLRMSKQKAQDEQSPLLPELKTSRADLNEIILSLPWLESLPNKSKVSWESVFRHWLRHHLLILCNIQDKVNWSDVARLAAWRIIERERYPFLIAARRRLFQSVPLAEAKIKSIFALEAPIFSRASRAPFEALAERAKPPGDQNDFVGITAASVQSFFGAVDDEEDPESAIIPERTQRLGEGSPESNYKNASRILSLLREGAAKKTDLRKSLLAWADDKILDGPGETDLRNLLRWSARVLEQSEASTAQTYAGKVLRALYSMSNAAFAEWETEDVAEYLENYATAASVNIVRSSLQQFDHYLVEENLAEDGRIAWNSRSLKTPATYSARDVLSNAEYSKAREMITASAQEDESLKLRQLCLLTLLRRCGLRVSEATYLTRTNFQKGYSKWSLEITRSKTRAGLRKLPLFLLLDEREIYEMRQFVRLQCGDSHKTLFSDAQGNPAAPHFLGREAEKLLRRAGIEGETAHGLRHAFANALFASFWLNLTEARVPADKSNPVRRALRQYARPVIEGRAVPQPIHLQQLLGHSDLRVTFERYIHFLELVGTDAVWLYENDAAAAPDFVNFKVAANILGMDENLMRREVGSLANAAVNLYEVARISSSRLP